MSPINAENTWKKSTQSTFSESEKSYVGYIHSRKKPNKYVVHYKLSEIFPELLIDTDLTFVYFFVSKRQSVAKETFR